MSSIQLEDTGIDAGLTDSFPVRISVIARGVPVGGDLEYADEITLGRSILGRTLFS